MIFTETKLKGAYILEPEKTSDERGFFARTVDAKIFEEKGLKSHFVQCSISYNKTKGTLRGFHYQLQPHEEAKLVRCTNGKIYDVIIDLRKNSNTFKEWFWIELSKENYKMLYIPEGFAHAFQTLEDDTEIFYQISVPFMPDFYRGIRWNDPSFQIKWPLEVSEISKKDLLYPLFC